MTSRPSAEPVVEAETRFRTRSYELDSYGHLNHGVYVSWFEEAREDLLRRGGFDYGRFPREFGVWFVVARAEIDFRKSLAGDDAATATTRLVRFGERSVVWRQALRFERDASLAAEARVVMCFSKDGGAVPIPQAFRAAFAPHPLGDSAAAP